MVCFLLFYSSFSVVCHTGHSLSACDPSEFYCSCGLQRCAAYLGTVTSISELNNNEPEQADIPGNSLSLPSAAVSALVDDICSECVRRGESWTDSSFPPSVSSLFVDPSHPHESSWLDCQWKRIGEVFPSPSLFVPPVAPHDIQQGKLGNCWFMSALAVLTLRQEAVFACFVTPEYSTHGVYAIRFFKDGKQAIVIIDDYIPVLPVSSSSSSGSQWEPLFAHSRDGREMWALLIEKAFAKLYHSYQATEGGWVDDALVELTGGVSERLSWQDPVIKQQILDGSLFNHVLDCCRHGFLLGCGSPAGKTDKEEDATEQGIIQSHAYSILRVISVDGLQLVYLRNPWGRKEWTGDWSADSPCWTSRLKEKVGYVNAEHDGSFWMSWTDFCHNFDELYICRFFDDSTWRCQGQVTGEWKGQTAGGCCNHATVKNNIQYAICCVGDGEGNTSAAVDCVFQLIQADVRGVESATFPLIILELYHADGQIVTQQQRGQMLANKGANAASVHIQVSLPTSTNSTHKILTLLPCTYEAGTETSYVLRWYATQNIHIQIFRPTTTEILMAADTNPLQSKQQPPIIQHKLMDALVESIARVHLVAIDKTEPPTSRDLPGVVTIEREADKVLSIIDRGQQQVPLPATQSVSQPDTPTQAAFEL